jgi:hypothetical protein
MLGNDGPGRVVEVAFVPKRRVQFVFRIKFAASKRRPAI